MTSGMDYSATFNYANIGGLSQLRHGASQGDAGAIDAAAQQFEALFIQMMMKSMRDASFGDSLFDGPGMSMYRDLMDKEMSLDLAKNGGIGLADSIRRFLDPQSALPARRGRDLEDYQGSARPAATMPTDTLSVLAGRGVRLAEAESVGSKPVDERKPIEVDKPFAAQAAGSSPPAFDGSMQGFVAALAEPAERVGQELGIHPLALIAQAALETGWGRHLMADESGEKSWNLFGIKARKGQPAVEADTQEFRNGRMQAERAAFRWFESLEEAFDGYASLIGRSPRYRQAVAEGQDPERYAKELQRAGYATDPDYASKIINILRRPGLAESWQQVMPASSFSIPGR